MGGWIYNTFYPGGHFQLVDLFLCSKKQILALQFPLCGACYVNKVKLLYENLFLNNHNYFRNLCNVCLTLWLVFLAKLVQLPWLLKATSVSPAKSTDDLDLTQSTSMPLMCEILSMTDQFLMTTLMFYLASLSLYLISRKPNPPLQSIIQTNWKENKLVE